MTIATRHTMTRTTLRARRALRKRKERNQRIFWLVKDTIGATCFFGSLIGALYIAYGFAL